MKKYYILRPIAYVAIQWTGDNVSEFEEYLPEHYTLEVNANNELEIYDPLYWGEYPYITIPLNKWLSGDGYTVIDNVDFSIYQELPNANIRTYDVSEEI